MVVDLEEKLAAAVKKLKEHGLVSPYLRSFVVARINPSTRCVGLRANHIQSKRRCRRCDSARQNSMSRRSSRRIWQELEDPPDEEG
jgi:hypothetical protein